ncbi:MAG: cytidine deaminase [Saccharofermentans sp.]|nr:cytidine deaminase [Saccharofermentans sp.]
MEGINHEFDRASLIQSAISVLKNSYAPYSRFNVAASVLCSSGRIYTGVNVENASYPAGRCAECNAIANAVGNGESKIEAIAVIGGKGAASDPDSVTSYCSPCGVCRQVMREFSDPNKLLIIMAKSPSNYKEVTLTDLLPSGFGPDKLQ